MCKREEGRERGRLKIMELSNFSLPEVRGDCLEVEGSLGKLGASGQVVSEAAILWEPHVRHRHAHTHNTPINKELVLE